MIRICLKDSTANTWRLTDRKCFYESKELMTNFFKARFFHFNLASEGERQEFLRTGFWEGLGILPASGVVVAAWFLGFRNIQFFTELI